MTQAKILPFLIIISLTLLPSFQQVFSHDTNNNQHIPDQIMQAMITQACTNIEDQISCFSNIQSRLPNGPHNATGIFTAALEASLDKAQQAAQMVSNFNSFSSSTAREQIAVEDCKELLDFSVTELTWSLTEMRKLRGGNNGPETNTNNMVVVHDPRGDLEAWLSAALSNQDTCLEGFEGTNRHVENYIKGGLTQVTQLISNVLTLYTQLHALPFRPPRHNYHNGNSTNNGTRKIIDDDPAFPKWMTEGDKGLVVASSPNGMHVDATVALDGSGKFQSIAEAVDDAPNHSNRRYVIYVKKGVYNENIDMKKKKTNIMLIGDGIGATVISGNRNFMQGWTTFRTATFAVSGKGFIAKDITFRNNAGPNHHQAVALRVDSDQSAFYRCSMEGYQDTLYAHSLRQFYRECNIYGTIDFIFGNGAAVIQNSNIYTRTGLPLQKVTITAQGRKSPHQSTGFSIQGSYVYANQPSYLGRPWKPFSRVVYMNTYLSANVEPKGWLEWYGNFGLNTLYFGEYRNYGPGASLADRVKWAGFHIIRDASEAVFFTVERFIDGMTWLPATGVKFSAGLTN